jgi:hypothetical protein
VKSSAPGSDFHRLFIPRDASGFLIVGLFPELREAGVLVLGGTDAVHEIGEPRWRRFGLPLGNDLAAVEHRFQEDEDAKEMPVGSGEHDGGHAADDGEVNDEDTAEGLLAEPFNPSEGPGPEPNEIEEKIEELKDGDTG